MAADDGINDMVAQRLNRIERKQDNQAKEFSDFRVLITSELSFFRAAIKVGSFAITLLGLAATLYASGFFG